MTCHQAAGRNQSAVCYNQTNTLLSYIKSRFLRSVLLSPAPSTLNVSLKVIGGGVGWVAWRKELMCGVPGKHSSRRILTFTSGYTVCSITTKQAAMPNQQTEPENPHIQGERIDRKKSSDRSTRLQPAEMDHFDLPNRRGYGLDCQIQSLARFRYIGLGTGFWDSRLGAVRFPGLQHRIRYSELGR